ncbi:MAG: Hpt domain-containing protein, partial [Gemmatimonadota bacterium]
MDLSRFLDLFISESQEHVALLHRSLIALESDAAAVDEAFRAAHTLKGLAAAMGYAAVGDLSHELEDTLEEIRGGRLETTSVLIDTLLGQADALEAAVALAAATPPGTTAPGAATATAATESAGSAAPGTAEPVRFPEGTRLAARVTLLPDTPIKAARAMLIMRSLAEHQGVLGSAPAAFDDDFGGEFSVFLGEVADEAAVEAAIRGAGDVASVELVAPAQAAPVAASPAGAGSAAPQRQVRVDGRRLDGIAEGIGELSVLYGRMAPAASATPAGLDEILARMGSLVKLLQHEVLALRMVPVREAFERLPRVVRDASRKL